ncbi:MAG: tripartite tricarboxylate transporter substrate binding protein [Deltaproteobacteria bacterium]|nr:tripartite tricarboxylate transporter substrate binding protein [Deltaproteobacteria bacterium]
MHLRKSRKSVVALFVFSFVMLLLTEGVTRAEYPEKPITIIVPWVPGGASDVTPRSLLKTMSEELKQPVVIVNRPGASGVVGTLEMERAVPDGYTIGTYSYSQTLTNFTTPNPPNLSNVIPVAKVMYSPATLTVNAGFPAKNLAEFVQYAKANPGKVRAAHSGKGTSAHIFGEAFDRLTGIKQTHVPFAGYAPAITAVAGGHIEATFIPVGDVHPMVKAGKLRMLAVAMQERHYLHPDVPTMKELKVNLDTGNWVGFIAPKGVPEAIVAKLDRAIEKALKSPEVVKSWREMGNVTTYLNYRDFAKWLVTHAAETRSLVESMGLLVVPVKQ